MFGGFAGDQYGQNLGWDNDNKRAPAYSRGSEREQPLIPVHITGSEVEGHADRVESFQSGHVFEHVRT